MFKIAQLILTPGRKMDMVCDIYIAQPDANKEAMVGKLFVMAEIKGKKATGLKLLNFIINSLNNNYYQNEKIYLIEKISTLKPEHIFESSLAKSNEHFKEFIGREKIKIDNFEINLTAGIIHEDNIYFTNTGNNKAMLLYPDTAADKNTNINKYKMADIAKQTADEKTGRSDKLYRSVVSGRISQSGYFLITNETLPEYLSSKQLIEIITTLPPAGAAEQIKNLLLKINALVPFLGLLIKNASRREAEVKTGRNIAEISSSTQDSIAGLNVTEDQTEKLLMPSGIINFKKFSALIKAPASLFARGKTRRPQTLILKDKSLIHKKINVFFLKKIFIGIKNFFIHVFNLIFYLLKASTNKEKFLSAISRVKNKTSNKFSQSLIFYKSLSKKSKVFIVIFLISIFLLFQNMFIINYKNKEVEEKQQYSDLIQLIEQKQNQAEANLLYSNDEGAKKLFDEIESLVGELPQESKEQQEEIIQFQEKLSLQLEKLRKVSRVKTDKIADISEIEPSAEINSIALSLEGKKIFASDNQSKTIYLINPENKEVTTLAEVGESIKTLIYPIGTSENKIYYFNNDNIIEFDANAEDFNYLPIDLASEPGGIADADIYNARYYALAPANNQIYRHNRAGQAFGTGQPWIESRLVLDSAVSLSIDGHIYVLKKTGEVLKMLRGELVEFGLEAVDPELSDCSEIFASREGESIYILEPPKQRLVVFDKAGQFITQYTSEQFDNLSGFSIDESNKQIYILNGNTVYAFEGTHF